MAFPQSVSTWLAAGALMLAASGFAAASDPTGAGVQDGAQLAQAVITPGTNRVLDLVCNSAPGWEKAVQDDLRSSYPNRAAATDRAVDLVRQAGARGARCAPSVPALATLTKREVCSLFPIASICVRRFSVPIGAHAFDFQPAGGRLYPGFRAIVPGDPRIIGGVGVAYNDAFPASGDGIQGVEGFRVQIPNGLWRVVMISTKRPEGQSLAGAFGEHLFANGRRIEIVQQGPDRWLPRAALSNYPGVAAFRPDQVLPGISPSLVFPLTVLNGEVELRFPQGAEIAAIVFEPAGSPSAYVLDGPAISHGYLSDEACLAQQQRIDREVSQIPPPPPTTTDRCRGGVCRPPGNDCTSTPSGSGCGGPVSAN